MPASAMRSCKAAQGPTSQMRSRLVAAAPLDGVRGGCVPAKGHGPRAGLPCHTLLEQPPELDRPTLPLQFQCRPRNGLKSLPERRLSGGSQPIISGCGALRCVLLACTSGLSAPRKNRVISARRTRLSSLQPIKWDRYCSPPACRTSAAAAALRTSLLRARMAACSQQARARVRLMGGAAQLPAWPWSQRHWCWLTRAIRATAVIMHGSTMAHER
jgi:hypothetical protein